MASQMQLAPHQQAPSAAEQKQQQRQESPQEELLPLKIATVEVALDMCNDISGFISERVAELQKQAGDHEAEIQHLYEQRRYFLRTIKPRMTLDNMDYVREFMDEYGPQIKQAYSSGELPAFLSETQPS